MDSALRRWETAVDTPALPSALADRLRGAAFVEIVRSYPAPSRVYRVLAAGHPPQYLKVGASLAGERDRLAWLEGKLNVPRVLGFKRSRGHEFLLVSGVPGEPVDVCLSRLGPATLIERMLAAAGALKATPTTGCPFRAGASDLLAEAEENVRRGLVQREQLGRAYRDREPGELLAEARELNPPQGEASLTHGDFCLPNVILDSNGGIGFVDLGSAGLGDRWRDLSLMARSIARACGERWASSFLRAAGEATRDPRRRFYALVDQLTMARGPFAGGVEGGP